MTHETILTIDFLDGISGNWVLKLRETGLDTPTVPGMS